MKRGSTVADAEGRSATHLTEGVRGQVVHDGGGGDGLARAGGPLDERQGRLQRHLDGGRLRGVQLWQPWRAASLGQCPPHRLGLHLVAQQPASNRLRSCVH